MFESKNGTTALPVIDQLGGDVDLLVTDGQMPNMNGIALVRAVQAKYADVPIIMMSGYLSDPSASDRGDAYKCIS